ncbi:ABC transporter-like protein [Bacillus sp. OxB-1]|uniref:ATP-binding cassette domain-containing protein n=1 Tax=Bacillus sp. (strain OxB-1) TaxID=98228 RepID=UPI000582015D|nr:ATP-binding cassette domain-containing protein [Bacillus sp. OxB-1]BAQ10321.1 ABC transporter-like protein [Bacillus sp. OxB-1]
MKRKEAEQKALRWLERVGLPDPERIVAAYPHELSGGMRQRIQLALTASLEPALLIADEPTTALDLPIQATVLRLLKDWQVETGGTLLMITHDLGVAADVGNRILVMSNGRLVEDAPVRRLFRNPKSETARRLLNNYRTLAGIPENKADSQPKEVPLIEAHDVSKVYVSGGFLYKRGFQAVDGASLTVGAGEIVGLIGESGGGKSTLSRLLLGLESCSEGHIHWQGTTNWPDGVQWVHQDPAASFNPGWTAGRIVGEGLEYRKVDARTRQQVTETLLEKVGLPPETAQKYPHELSGGMRQRIALARALAVQPELLVLDEPFASLDMSTQAKMIDLVRSFREQDALSILFITHDIRTALALCSRIYVIQNGRIVDEQLAAELSLSRQPFTQSLLAHIPGGKIPNDITIQEEYN